MINIESWDLSAVSFVINNFMIEIKQTRESTAHGYREANDYIIHAHELFYHKLIIIFEQSESLT